MIAILGIRGMLGSMVWRHIKGIGTTRDTFSVDKPDKLLLKEAEWVINCIGLIKPYCNEVEQAIRINALFPYSLPENTIQIATDCVYSGKKGGYVETDPHDALDVYGKTKSLGEASHIKNLRCSIIGPEVKNHLSLLDWALSLEKANGFTNHQWNGITTYHFSKICQGIIREGIELPILQHIVPANSLSKADLLRCIAYEFKHNLEVTDVEATESVDRTLATNNPGLNKMIWRAAGYDHPPTIERMIKELAEL